MFYRRLKRSICISVSLFLVFSTSSCYRVREIPSFEKSLFYALPGGGIALYDFSVNKEIKLTNGLDYYPAPLRDGETILFLRFKEVFVGKGENKKSKIETYIYSYNARLNRERQIVKLKDFSPGRDLKDDCYFVGDGKYLLALSYAHQYELISVETGESVNLSILDFMHECNQYDLSGEDLYLRVRQYPRKEIFKNPEYLESPSSFEALILLDNEFNMTKLFEIPKDKMFSSTIYGFTLSQELNILAFSVDKEICLIEGNKVKKLTSGVHPTFLKKNVIDKPIFNFPFSNLSFVFSAKTSKEENILFCAKNYLSKVDLSKKSFHLLTSEDAILGTTYKEYDKAYLFSDLAFIGKLSTDDLFILVSYKEGDPTAGPENILSVNESPDMVILFSFLGSKFVKKADIYGGQSMEIEFKDLNGDSSFEIIVQYAASNFSCEEKFKVAGRALVWKDIYSISETGEYKLANGEFPAIYEELLKQLEPLYSNALAAKRLKQPILCDDDLKTLEQLIRDAKAIVYLYR